MCGTTGKRPARVRRRPCGARGFTLLELIIVLAILSMLIVMAWPALRRPVTRSAVQQAARQLVRDLARARMAAIDSGQIVALRWEVGGPRYVVEPAESLDDSQDATPAVIEDGDLDSGGIDSGRTDSDGSDSGGTDSGGTDSGGTDSGGRGNAATATDEADAPAAVAFAAQLEEQVVFRDPAEVVDEDLPAGSTLKEMLEDEQQEREAVKPLIESDTADETFSPPVFFYPTGRAENVEFALQGPDGYRITVKLRGLTGAASLGPLEHEVRQGRRADRPDQELDRQTPDRQDPDRQEPLEEFSEPEVSNKLW